MNERQTIQAIAQFSGDVGILREKLLA